MTSIYDEGLFNQTFTKDPHPVDQDTELGDATALPYPDWAPTTDYFSMSFVSPGEAEMNNYRWDRYDGVEQDYKHPIPDVTNIPTGFPKLSDDKGVIPQKRQKKYRGRAEKYHKKWYRTNKVDKKRDSRVRYHKIKNKVGIKKDQKNRNKFPHRFERKPDGIIKIASIYLKDFYTEIFKGIPKKANCNGFYSNRDLMPVNEIEFVGHGFVKCSGRHYAAFDFLNHHTPFDLDTLNKFFGSLMEFDSMRKIEDSHFDHTRGDSMVKEELNYNPGRVPEAPFSTVGPDKKPLA
jgi:hypothetical protein